MTDSDYARANDEDLSQMQADLGVHLLSRLKASPHAKTIEEELDRIVAEVCEFTIEMAEESKKLQVDMIRELNGKIKQLNDTIKKLEKDMGKSEKATKRIRAFIERRRMEAQPAMDTKFLNQLHLVRAYEIDWKLLLEETQQVVNGAGQEEMDGNAPAHEEGA